MPELPEVETVRIGLARLLPGRRVASVLFDWPKSFPNAPEDVQNFLVGAAVTAVRRRAKVLIIDLDSAYSLIVHLKMTGQLVFIGPVDSPRISDMGGEMRETPDPPSSRIPHLKSRTLPPPERFGAGHPNDSLIGELPDKSTRVTLSFADDSRLFFNDQRKFGWMRLLPTVEVAHLDFFQKVGPEPLAADFNWEGLRARLLTRPGTTVKAALLDQAVVAGIGNIYADESLWGARIHPATPVKSFRAEHFRKLYEELIFVLELSIEKGGSTDRNYVNAEGKRGSYLTFARVFRRDGQPCPRCGAIILKTRVAGRGTHFCPHCQRLPKSARPVQSRPTSLRRKAIGA